MGLDIEVQDRLGKPMDGVIEAVAGHCAPRTRSGMR